MAKQTKSAPKFDLLIDAGELPKGVSQKQIAALFANAWSIVPASRRPEIQNQKKLAVDIYVISDAEIAELNAQHMKHKGPTDVLSFPLGDVDPERKAFHLGEIIVSIDTARREAKERGLSESEELSRYIVHGFLHLLGYEDDSEAKRKAMFKVQEAALQA